MLKREIDREPFGNSVWALALLAMHETGASGFAVFTRRSEGTGLMRQVTCGAAIEAAALDGKSKKPVAQYPLQRDEITEGVLAFSFEDNERLEQARPSLDRMAAAISAVWTSSPKAGRYSDLLNQVVELEAQLNDSKITDRALGFLANPGSSNAIETMAQHVYRVLRPAPTLHVLEQMQRTLQEEVDTRVAAARAKEILQSVKAMSEEEAYAYLHAISRRSRRRLKEVAEELIAAHVVQQSPA